MPELEMKGKIEGTNGYALVKRIHIVIVVSVLILTNLIYILYREFTTKNVQEEHERRLIKLENQYVMNQETNMNLKEYLKANGYKWIEIPVK